MSKIWEMMVQYTESFWPLGDEAIQIIKVIFTIGISIIAILFVLAAIGIFAESAIQWIRDTIQKPEE